MTLILAWLLTIGILLLLLTWIRRLLSWLMLPRILLLLLAWVLALLPRLMLIGVLLLLLSTLGWVSVHVTEVIGLLIHSMLLGVNDKRMCLPNCIFNDRSSESCRPKEKSFRFHVSTHYQSFHWKNGVLSILHGEQSVQETTMPHAYPMLTTLYAGLPAQSPPAETPTEIPPVPAPVPGPTGDPSQLPPMDPPLEPGPSSLFYAAVGY